MAKNPSPLKGLLAASFKSTMPIQISSEIVDKQHAPSLVEVANTETTVSDGEIPPAATSTPEVPAEEPKEVTSEIAQMEEAAAEASPAVEVPVKISKPKAEGTRGARSTKATVVEDPLPPLEFDGVKKTTVSFYAAEQAQVDRILDTLLRARRHRGGFSDAIKIALRLCPIDPAQIAKAWDEARAADRRTTRK